MDRLLVSLGSVIVVCAVAFALFDAQSSIAADAGLPSNAARAQGTPLPKSAAKDALDWNLLTAYEYEPGLKKLPDALKALEGTTVTLRGYILPIVEFDDIHEFCVVPNHSACCFGMPAGINGQVQVTLRASERGLPYTNEPIEVRGIFRAIETKDLGILLSIFRLDDATARIVGY